MNSTKKQSVTKSTSENTRLSIMDKDEVISIDYADLEDYHEGNSWLGCSVGFRAMQAAIEIFTRTSTCSRNDLYIVSGHAGPGVKDAIDLVTHCIREKRFRLLDDIPTAGCSSDMKFEWWVSNGHITVHIKLQDNFIPSTFYSLLNRINTDDEKNSDRDSFDEHKKYLSQQLWYQSLESLFDVELLTTPLSPGSFPCELPGVLADA